MAMRKAAYSVGEKQDTMSLSAALVRIDRATDRFCLVIEAMPDINDEGLSVLVLAASWCSAEVKKRIMESTGEEYRWKDFISRDSAGRLLRLSPVIGEERELGPRLTRNVRKYTNKLDRFSDKLGPLYACEPLVMDYLRKMSIASVKVR